MELENCRLYIDDLDREIHYSHENPAVIYLYENYIHEPLGALSEKLFHTTYRQKPEYKK